MFEDRGGKWRWRLRHRNGEIIADSGEGYAERTNAQDGIESVRNTVGDDDAFDVYEDAEGKYRWRLLASNDEILADGGQGFASERGARDSIDRVQEHAPAASMLDYGDAAFEVYEDRGGAYRWRLVHENGQTLGDSGQGYASRTGAIDGLQSVKRNAPNATVEDLAADDEAAEGADDEAAEVADEE